MSLTYLDLVNKVLVRLNEAKLTVDTFNDDRNIQTQVKNAVREIVNKINRMPEWPFNNAKGTQVLVPGQQDYLWPSDFSSVDWNSFSIQKNTTFNVNTRELVRVDRDQWYMYQKSTDLDNATGIRVPTAVFESHSYGFSVSPSPDRAYTVTYDYFKKVPVLVNPNDDTTIPEDFDYVPTDGAMIVMYAFKEDKDGMDRMEAKFKEGILDMRRVFGQQRTYLSDHRIARRRSPQFFGVW